MQTNPASAVLAGRLHLRRDGHGVTFIGTKACVFSPPRLLRNAVRRVVAAAAVRAVAHPFVLRSIVDDRERPWDHVYGINPLKHKTRITSRIFKTDM